MKFLLAKAIRVVSVPPAAAAIFIIVLFNTGALTWAQFVWAFISLTLLPLAAYPLSFVVPAVRRRGRNGQRNLAFALSALGYVILFVYGLASKASGLAMLVFSSYLFSLVFLLFFNKILRRKASGHACGVTGPAFILSAALGWPLMLLSLIAYFAVMWASVKDGQHTVGEFILGSVSFFAALAISALLYL